LKNHPESDLQKLCVKYLMLAHPHCFFYHSPNEGKRSPQYWNWLKSLGTKTGMLDLLIFDAKKGFNGLAIELKSGKGTLTKNQKDMIKNFELVNWQVYICSSFESFQKAVDDYFSKAW